MKKLRAHLLLAVGGRPIALGHTPLPVRRAMRHAMRKIQRRYKRTRKYQRRLIPRSPPALAVTVVQHKENNTGASSTQVSVTVSSTTAGNLLVGGGINDGTRTLSTVSDGTTTFTQATSAAATLAPYQTDIHYLLSANSGKTSITFTFSGSAGTFTKYGWVWEVSGFTTVAFDLAAGGNTRGASNTVTGASVTTTGTTGFVVGICVTTDTITANPKSGNEFTAGGDTSTGGAAAGGVSLISSTAAAHRPDWTTSTSAPFDCYSTAAFKETASGTARVGASATQAGWGNIAVTWGR